MALNCYNVIASVIDAVRVIFDTVGLSATDNRFTPHITLFKMKGPPKRSGNGMCVCVCALLNSYYTSVKLFCLTIDVSNFRKTCARY